MFLAYGKKDDYDAKTLVKMLQKKTGVPADSITGVQVSDAYSFFNVGKKDADAVLSSLNKEKGARPIVEIAKPK